MFPSEEKIKLLARAELFEPLSREEVEDLSWKLPDAAFEAGELIYSPEQPSVSRAFGGPGEVVLRTPADEGVHRTRALLLLWLRGYLLYPPPEELVARVLLEVLPEEEKAPDRRFGGAA